MENNEIKNILNQIKICLIVIAAILLVNTFILIIVNGDSYNDNNTTSTEEETADYDISSFKQVTATELYEEVKSSNYTVVYIGRPTCSYCVKFLPIMKQAQEEFNFTTLYLDIREVIDFTNNKIADQTAYDTISAYDSYVSENFGATPMVLVFKDGKYVNGTVGYQELSTYESFLTESGLTK